MPLRKYQYARKSIDKTKLADDAQVKVETQLIILKGAGADITGNAGTTYMGFAGSRQLFEPDHYKNILKVELAAFWDPKTASGGIRLYNISDTTAVVTFEPGDTGWRWSKGDATTAFKGYTVEKELHLESKGDGTTAPVVRVAYLRVVIDITS